MPIPALIIPLMDEKALRLLWDDDHISTYPFPYLRGWCPCASCQGHSGERQFIRVENPQLETISPVGNYALNLRWSDGHDTGIYTFEFLRTLSDRFAELNENSAER
jgi:DUF971 family protein